MRVSFMGYFTVLTTFESYNSPFCSSVTGGNEAGVDHVLIQPFLLHYVNHVVLMLSSIF